MKRKVKIMGVDDSPFSFEDKNTRLVGVVVRAPNYLEGVLSCMVTVDGLDSTEKIAQMLNGSGHEKQIRGIMVNGACVAGFNAVDIEGLTELTGVGTMTITNNRPGESAVRDALRKHFPDWKERLDILEKGKKITIKIEEGKRSYELYARYCGMGGEEAIEMVDISRVRGSLPEPARMAHVIASALR